jgi:hypothetical protein
MTLVALSAAYGAGGSRIGPALADRLGVPFLDRAIPLGAAGLDREATTDVEDEGFFERLLRGFAGMTAGGPAAIPEADEFRERTERELLEHAAGGEGVVLGRAAVILLRDDPRVLRARLTGPEAARARRAAELAGIDVDVAEERRKRVDRAHVEYARRFYGADLDDPQLYHLVLDTTAVGIDAAVDILDRAVRALEV